MNAKLKSAPAIAMCPECGAAQRDGQSCQDYFHQLLAWEFENPDLLDVHHLTVLCYHLQHPALYSPEGLAYGKQLLVDFVERGASPEQVRQRNRATVDSGKRKWKIAGTPAAHGSYSQPVEWTLNAGDVVAGGTERYCGNVRAWACSILESLRASGNQ